MHKAILDRVADGGLEIDMGNGMLLATTAQATHKGMTVRFFAHDELRSPADYEANASA